MGPNDPEIQVGDRVRIICKWMPGRASNSDLLMPVGTTGEVVDVAAASAPLRIRVRVSESLDPVAPARMDWWFKKEHLELIVPDFTGIRESLLRLVNTQVGVNP